MRLSLGDWMKQAGAAKVAALAKAAGTSRATLSQIAYGHRGGSADMAVKVVRASFKFAPQLPAIDQGTVCKACGEFAPLQPKRTKKK